MHHSVDHYQRRKLRGNPIISRCLVCSGPNTGIFLIMTYNIQIDQLFAVENDLTLTQVSTLSAFATLPLWADTVAIDGHVWYKYSEEKMCEDFPLLFGCTKRCYKNIAELANAGFVELTKLGRIKYVRFTERCACWGKQKDLKRTESPKKDEKKSENGLNDAKKSPKTDSNYNIKYDHNIIDNNIHADGGLFPGADVEKKSKLKGTTENLCLFADSRYSDFNTFCMEFSRKEFENVDIAYYYEAVKDWSAQRGKKMKDWIATARNFMRRDLEERKLHILQNPKMALSPDALKYLQEMA